MDDPTLATANPNSGSALARNAKFYDIVWQALNTNIYGNNDDNDARDRVKESISASEIDTSENFMTGCLRGITFEFMDFVVSEWRIRQQTYAELTECTSDLILSLYLTGALESEYWHKT